MNELQVVVFSLNGQLFCSEVSQVFQIIKYQDASKVPGMPRFIEGILNYRDSELPVISLVRRFNLGEPDITKKTKILTVNINDKLVGFIVNDVTEILKLTDEDIEPAPLIINSEASAYIKKVCKRNDKLISIIDLEKVLNDDEIRILSDKLPKN